MVFVNADPDNVTCFSDDIDLVNVDLNNVSLYDDPKNIIHVILMAWCNRCKQRKVSKNKISKESMPVAWHPTGW